MLIELRGSEGARAYFENYVVNEPGSATDLT